MIGYLLAISLEWQQETVPIPLCSLLRILYKSLEKISFFLLLFLIKNWFRLISLAAQNHTDMTSSKKKCELKFSLLKLYTLTIFLHFCKLIFVLFLQINEMLFHTAVHILALKNAIWHTPLVP